MRAADGTDNEALLRKASAAVEDGFYREADKSLEKYLKRSRSADTRAQGKIVQAQSYVGQKRYADAVKLINGGQERVKDASLKVGLLYWKARALYELDLVKEAADGLSDLPAKSTSPWFVPAHFLHVRVERALGNRDKAIEAMTQFDKTYSEHAEAPVNLLELSLLLLESNKAKDAVEHLRSLITRFSDSVSAVEGKLWLARELHETDQADEAIALLQALSSNEDAPTATRLEALRSLASFYEKSGELKEALVVLNQALAFKPPAEEAALLKSMQALIQVGLGQEVEAIAAMHEAVQVMTNQVAASRLQLRLSDQLLKRKSYALAYDEYQRFLEVFTDGEGRGLAALGKAWSLFGLKRYAEAAEYFEQAAAGVKDVEVLKESMIKLADAWFASEHYEDATKAYERFLEKFPASSWSVNARFQLAESLARMGRTDEAVAQLRGLEERAEKKAQARLAALRVAELRQREGRLDLAVAAYDWILNRYDDDESLAQATLGRATVRYNQGLFYESLKDLEEIGGRFPKTPYAEQAMAMSVWCQYLAGRDQEALELASDFIEAYPKSAIAPQIQFWKAEYRYNRDEFSKAEELFTSLSRTYPTHDLADDALFWAGRSAFERKEYRDAIALDKELIERFPKSSKRAEARFAQGDALSKLGEFSGAILAFEEIIKQFPNHYLVGDARGRIGDCHFTLGAQDPARYRESLDAYRMILSGGRASLEMTQQSLYKIGRCHEKLDDGDQALDHYLEAVYGYLESVRSGKVVSSVWFSRAAFAGADLLEEAGRLKEAANLYKRVVSAQVPATEDAQRRLQKLRLEHWRIL